jgi:hypothetical protein
VYNTGLRVFKTEWGTDEHPLGYTMIGDGVPRAAPPKLEKFVGTVIRHSPAFVCTMTGELLYRHFA